MQKDASCKEKSLKMKKFVEKRKKTWYNDNKHGHKLSYSKK